MYKKLYPHSCSIKYLPYLPSFLLILVLSCLVEGCAQNPFAIAQTGPQKAFALELVYNKTLKSAIKVARNPATPQVVVRSIQEADRIGTPLVDSMSEAAEEYVIAEARLSSCGPQTDNEPDKLPCDKASAALRLVADQLDDWYIKVERALTRLNDATKRGE